MNEIFRASMFPCYSHFRILVGTTLLVTALAQPSVAQNSSSQGSIEEYIQRNQGQQEPVFPQPTSCNSSRNNNRQTSTSQIPRNNNKLPTEIAEIAKQTVVQIKSVSGLGSGVIIGHYTEGTKQVYVVLTAAHVVPEDYLEYSIVLPSPIDKNGRERITISGSEIEYLPNIDLAIVRFYSDRNYACVALGDSDYVTEGTGVYVAGFPATGEAIRRLIFQFSSSLISSRLDLDEFAVEGEEDLGALEGGYAMVYTNVTRTGMSGGPVFDTAGRLVGIHGMGDMERISFNPSGDLPVEANYSAEEYIKTGFKLGIPIKTFLNLRPDAIRQFNLELDPSRLGVSSAIVFRFPQGQGEVIPRINIVEEVQVSQEREISEVGQLFQEALAVAGQYADTRTKRVAIFNELVSIASRLEEIAKETGDSTLEAKAVLIIYQACREVYSNPSRPICSNYVERAEAIASELIAMTTTARSSLILQESGAPSSDLLPTIISINLLYKGDTLFSDGKYQEAITFYEQALTRQWVVIPRPLLKSRIFYKIALAHEYLSEYDSALHFYQKALAIEERHPGVGIEASILDSIGRIHYQRGEYSEALESYSELLAPRRQETKYLNLARTLNHRALAYNSLGRYAKALELYTSALELFQANNSQREIGAILNNIGLTQMELGQYEQALQSYEQALEIKRETDDERGEGNTLHNLGFVYTKLKDYEQAVSYYQQALGIRREIENKSGEALTLNNLGVVENERGNFTQALNYLELALKLFEEMRDRAGITYTLDSLGTVYATQGEYELALDYYFQSLATAKDIGGRPSERITLKNIGDLFAENGSPELAIIFYKRSVDVTEAIRQDSQELSSEQQQSYAESVADVYRDLADLLFQQDRILEAQRVLDLLKVQELDDYFNNVRGSDDSQDGIAQLTPEVVITDGYNAILEDAIELSKELAQLMAIPVNDRTEVQKQRVFELRKVEELLLDNFRNFLSSPEVQAELEKLNRQVGSENLDLDTYARSLQNDLQKIDNAVILSPLILDDRLELVLISADAPPLHRTVQVSGQDLKTAIINYRTLLTQPHDLQLGQEAAQVLYDYLIQPLEADLTALEVETIIYAPDGLLRYIPLSALYDGQQWLIENYNINNITALSLTNLGDQPTNKPLSILAGAFTDGQTTVTVGQRSIAFDSLPFAKVEVETLAATIPTTETRLDVNFNPGIQYEANDYSIVHLATHAKFVNGTPSESFILFNNNQKVTLLDVESWNLNNVDLVVLSACQTALGDLSGDGREILGLGYQMQRSGAKAILASLWSVNDGGTQNLMNQFYNVLANNSSITKAEALRQAQVSLIKKEDLSHPYYWSPFILIGNGVAKLRPVDSWTF